MKKMRTWERGSMEKKRKIWRRKKSREERRVIRKIRKKKELWGLEATYNYVGSQSIELALFPIGIYVSQHDVSLQTIMSLFGYVECTQLLPLSASTNTQRGTKALLLGSLGS